MNNPIGNGPKDFPDTEPMGLPGAPAEDPAFAETAPQPLANVRAPRSLDQLSLAPIEVTLYEVMGLVRQGNRVCPQPSRWLEFYRVIQEAAPGGGHPPEPLVGSAWAATPPLAKRMCFQQQLEWADGRNALQAAYDYLKSLRDSDWYVN